MVEPQEQRVADQGTGRRTLNTMAQSYGHVENLTVHFNWWAFSLRHEHRQCRCDGEAVTISDEQTPDPRDCD